MAVEDASTVQYHCKLGLREFACVNRLRIIGNGCVKISADSCRETRSQEIERVGMDRGNKADRCHHCQNEPDHGFCRLWNGDLPLYPAATPNASTAAAVD